MNRAEFAGGIAAAVLARFAQSRDDIGDPASEAQAQALRVLLGRGDAQMLDTQTFLFQGRRYRGSFSRTDDGQIVSVVPLEQYLYSVVSREMPHSWPAAALQAQAIVARTYVLQRSSPARQYDLVPSEADQVYTGMDAENSQSTGAVDATAGQVLRFGNGFAQVLYSSCCGGHTESNADAWGGAPLAYLRGVPCTYCNDSRWYAWSQKLPLAQVQHSMSSALGGIGDLTNIALDSPDASGRARFWVFTGTLGTQRVRASSVRSLLGTRTLPSLLVHRLQLDPVPDAPSDAPDPQAGTPPQGARTVTIEGGGLGHGVGLCQWGARGMALSGAGARAILAYYYPGTDIGND